MENKIYGKAYKFFFVSVRPYVQPNGITKMRGQAKVSQNLDLIIKSGFNSLSNLFGISTTYLQQSMIPSITISKASKK